MNSRREFLVHTCRGLAGAVAAGAGIPWWASCAGGKPTLSPLPGITVDVTRLAAEGANMVASQAGPDGAPILVVRAAGDGGGGYIALSLQCTHEGCPVNPPLNGTLTCPCHGSQFDLAGRVLRGPAEFPLDRYRTRYDPRSGHLAVTFGG